MTLNIKNKIPLMVILASLLTAVTIGVTNYLSAAKILRHEAELKLEAVTADRKLAVQNWLETVQQDLRLLGTSAMTRLALQDFISAWNVLQQNQTDYLREAYITRNPEAANPEALDYARDGSLYSSVHRQYHPWLRRLAEERGYEDVYLFDSRGNVIYSMAKAEDFATNIVDGSWQDTALASVYDRAATAAEPLMLQFHDFTPYAATDGTLDAFMATPVINDHGAFLGVMAVRLGAGTLRDVLQVVHGMGKSGESLLVSENNMILGYSGPALTETMVGESLKQTFLQRALTQNELGISEETNGKGASLIVGYEGFDFMGRRYAVLAREALDEVMAPVYVMRNTMLIEGLVVIILFGSIGYLFSTRQLVQPLMALGQAMGRIGAGKTATEVPGLDRKDEIGDMAAALQTFKETTIKAKELQEAEKREQERKAQRQQELAKLITGFDEKVSNVLRTVSSAATQMYATAEGMATTVNQTRSRSGNASTASEETMHKVQTVASAAEELSASINDITSQIGRSVKVVEDASGRAKNADGTVKTLSDAAERIGEVVRMISDIAEQINLLALNATIESARAGEAGKGFAVVASEVKNLASQTSKATEEIAEQIAGIQGVAGEVVDVLNNIVEGVDQIQEISSTIATSVEQQGAATMDITRNVQTAAVSVQDVFENIKGVNTDTEQADEAAKQVLEAAKMLSQESEQLSREVEDFLACIREG